MIFMCMFLFCLKCSCCSFNIIYFPVIDTKVYQLLLFLGYQLIVVLDFCWRGV